MKKADYSERIKQVVDRLAKLSEQDRSVIQNSSSVPVTISLDELLAYGERYNERQKLHQQLRQLASEPIED